MYSFLSTNWTNASAYRWVWSLVATADYRSTTVTLTHTHTHTLSHTHSCTHILTHTHTHTHKHTHSQTLTHTQTHTHTHKHTLTQTHSHTHMHTHTHTHTLTHTHTQTHTHSHTQTHTHSHTHAHSQTHTHTHSQTHTHKHTLTHTLTHTHSHTHTHTHRFSLHLVQFGVEQLQLTVPLLQCPLQLLYMSSISRHHTMAAQQGTHLSLHTHTVSDTHQYSTAATQDRYRLVAPYLHLLLLLFESAMGLLQRLILDLYSDELSLCDLPPVLNLDTSARTHCHINLTMPPAVCLSVCL